MLERIEADLRRELPNVSVFTHLESLNDPASWDDTALDRVEKSSINAPTGDHDGPHLDKNSGARQ